MRFQFISAKPCIATAGTAGGGGATALPDASQRWKFPWQPGQPNLAFAGGGGGGGGGGAVRGPMRL